MTARPACGGAAGARSSVRGHNPETFLQQRIRLALGCEPCVVLARNTVGVLRYYDETTGEPRYLTYGLGEGSADLVGVVGGRYCALEIKMPGQAPRLEQRRWAAMMRAAGAFCGVVHSEQEARDALVRCRKGLSE